MSDLAVWRRPCQMVVLRYTGYVPLPRTWCLSGPLSDTFPVSNLQIFGLPASVSLRCETYGNQKVNLNWRQCLFCLTFSGRQVYLQKSLTGDPKMATNLRDILDNWINTPMKCSPFFPLHSPQSVKVLWVVQTNYSRSACAQRVLACLSHG